MFVRIKRIKGNFYAYNVENKRIKGKVRQKSRKYLGKVLVPKKQKSKDFRNFIKKDYKEYSRNNYKKIISDLVTFEIGKHELPKIKVDIDRSIVEKDSSPIVLKINEGFLYNQTLKNLVDFNPVGDDNYMIGKEFAELFVKAGIQVPKELFVELFEKITQKIN